MKLPSVVLIICLLTLIVGDASAIKVTGVSVSISKKFDIDRKWYKKYTHVKGIPIVSSKKVNSRALLKSAGVINKVLLGNRYKLSKHLKKYRAKMAIVDKGKNFSDLPEVSFKSYDDAGGLACCGKYKWDTKSGSWKLYYQLAMTRENNALQLPFPKGTDNVGVSVITHEFAHLVHNVVLDNVYPKISKLIAKTYKAAKKKKLWKGAYAMTNEFEYFAEGTERWFNVRTREGKNYYTTGGPYPHNRKELKKHDIALYRLLKKIYGNGKWRFRYGRICTAAYTCENNYKLSTPFGPSLALAASENVFMVGEDFDLKIASTGASFSFDDYSYIDIAQSPGKSWQLGFKAEEGDLPQMGGNFAFGSQLGGIHYRVAADNTFLGSKGSGWLGYKDARSAYVNVGKQYSPGNKWNIAGDVTYGWSQADAEKEGVFQDFSKIHALGFNASAGYQLNTHNEIGIRLNSPLKVEKGSLVIKSPYDTEKVNLAPVGRELNLVLHHTHQFRNAATLTTSLQYTHDNGHTRDQESSRIMAEYSITF